MIAIILYSWNQRIDFFKGFDFNVKKFNNKMFNIKNQSKIVQKNSNFAELETIIVIAKVAKFLQLKKIKKHAQSK